LKISSARTTVGNPDLEIALAGAILSGGRIGYLAGRASPR
jgi:hypothetical protein